MRRSGLLFDLYPQSSVHPGVLTQFKKLLQGDPEKSYSQERDGQTDDLKTRRLWPQLFAEALKKQQLGA